MKNRHNIIFIWSNNLGYILGLLASDGNLSKDERHISFCSKDLELVKIIKKVLQIENKIGRFSRGYESNQKYYRVQFGDIRFYRFLNSLGLHKQKSRKIKSLDIPLEFFPDFLRGIVDGDGNICVYKHKESKHKQIKIRIASASLIFLKYILNTLKTHFEIKGGWITKQKRGNVFVLCFGKKESFKIINLMYYDTHIPFLKRKYIQAKQGQMAELARRASLRS